MTAGSLPAMPGTPIGQTSRAAAAPCLLAPPPGGRAVGLGSLPVAWAGGRLPARLRRRRASAVPPAPMLRRLYELVRDEGRREGAAGVRLYADDGNERAHEAYKVRRPPRKIAFATVVGSNKRQQPRVAAQRMCGRAWLPAEPRCAPGC